MDLLTMLSTCSLAKDFGLVLAMTMTFSHGDRFTVRAAADVGDVELSDLGSDAVDDPAPARTKEVALAEMKRTKEPVVGLLPVPVEWASTFQFSAADLLDACTNISIATAQLSEYERRCAERGGKRTRTCALNAYVEAAGIPLFEMAVLDTLREQQTPGPDHPVVIETDALNRSGLFAGGEQHRRARGPDRVFVQSEGEAKAPAKTAAARAPERRGEPVDNVTTQRNSRPEVKSNHVEQTTVDAAVGGE